MVDFQRTGRLRGRESRASRVSGWKTDRLLTLSTPVEMHPATFNRWLEALGHSEMEQEKTENAESLFRAADLFRRAGITDDIETFFNERKFVAVDLSVLLDDLAGIFSRRDKALSIALKQCAALVRREYNLLPREAFDRIELFHIWNQPDTGELVFPKNSPLSLGFRLTRGKSRGVCEMSTDVQSVHCHTLFEWSRALSYLSEHSRWIKMTTFVGSETLYISREPIEDDATEIAWNPSEKELVMDFICNLMKGETVEARFDHAGGNFWAPRRIFRVGLRLLAIARVLCPERSGPLRGQWKEPGIAGLWLEN